MSSQFQGVCPMGTVFRAQLFRCGKVYYLGCFRTAEEAAVYYDRAAKLAAPWSRRRVGYNYDEPKITPADPVLTVQEIDMLQDLRTRFPTEEESHQGKQALRDALPLETIEQVLAMANRFERLADDLRTQISAVKSTLLAAHSKVQEVEVMRDHFKARAEEAEAKLFVVSKRADPKNPLSIFRRVIPGQPEVPLERLPVQVADPVPNPIEATS